MPQWLPCLSCQNEIPAIIQLDQQLQEHFDHIDWQATYSYDYNCVKKHKTNGDKIC